MMPFSFSFSAIRVSRPLEESSIIGKLSCFIGDGALNEVSSLFLPVNEGVAVH
jgi:hypothetical protein